MAGGFQSNKIFILTLLLAAAGLAAYALFIFRSVPEERRRTPPEHIITFSGIEKNSIARATLTMNGRESPILFDDRALRLSQEQIANFTLPYEIRLNLQEGGEYYDIFWKVDSRGAYYDIGLDGFSAKYKITLRLNEYIGLEKIFFDWSGKIELPIVLESFSDIEACVDIFKENSKKPVILLCHLNKGART